MKVFKNFKNVIIILLAVSVICENINSSEKRIENVSIYQFYKEKRPLLAKNRNLFRNLKLNYSKNLRDLAFYIFYWLSGYLNDHFKTKRISTALKTSEIFNFQDFQKNL